MPIRPGGERILLGGSVQDSCGSLETKDGGRTTYVVVVVAVLDVDVGRSVLEETDELEE